MTSNRQARSTWVRLLSLDENTFSRRAARTYLRSRNAHPWRWFVIDLLQGAAVAAIWWFVAGKIAALSAAIFYAVLMLLPYVAKYIVARRILR